MGRTARRGRGRGCKKGRKKKRNVKKEDSNNNSSPANVTQVFAVNRPIVLVPNEALKSFQAANQSGNSKPRIPRPANAFMLFANENRKKVAKQYPQESNKEISCRLGNQWKSLPPEQKDKYFSMAKAVDAEHKKKYPDYVYNPKEARLRKALRERERSMGGGAGSAGACLPRSRRWSAAPTKMIPPNPSPHNLAAHHQPADHLMAGTAKDLRTIQNEFGRSFMNMSGGPGGGYFFSGPQYHVNGPSDYSPYIHVAPNSWMPNGYVQNNPMVQQQLWNQYQADRIRAHQAQSSAYMIAPEEPQYPHLEQIPQATNLMHQPSGQQIEQTATKEMITNIENSCSDVNTYLNINPSTSTCAANNATTVAEVNTPTNVLDVAAVCDEAGPNIVPNGDRPQRRCTDAAVVRDVQDLPGNLSAPAANPVDPNGENAPGESVDNATNGFDMQLFEEDGLANLNGQDLHKNMNPTNQLRNNNLNETRKNSGNSLPGFNQAFGSTERGRFQSAPEPIRVEEDYLQYFTSYNIKFEQYNKWADQTNNGLASPTTPNSDFNKLTY